MCKDVRHCYKHYQQYQTESSYYCTLQSRVIQSRECLSSVSDLRAHRICTRQLQNSNSCISTPIENWTHVYMNLFTPNSPYYQLLKYLLYPLKHPVCTHIYIYIYMYRMSQEKCARLREGVPYVKVYRYNPKHLCPKLNGYGDNGQRKMWSSCGSTHCTCQLTIPVLACGVILRQVSKR